MSLNVIERCCKHALTINVIFLREKKGISNVDKRDYAFIDAADCEAKRPRIVGKCIL